MQKNSAVQNTPLRNVVFVAPFPMETTLAFARAVGTLPGVRLLGLFQKAPPDPAAHGFHAIQIIDDALNVDVIVAGVEVLKRRFGPIHRLLGVLEDAQVQLGAARERLGIEGPTEAIAHRFRDKGAMKDTLRAAGIPCARHRRLRSDADAWSFVDAVGFPLVIKPPSGAGCRATVRVRNPQELAKTLAEFRLSPSREALAEEFLTGAEYSLEMITVAGEPRFWSVTRYYPSPLEVMEQDWVQWCVVLPRELDDPAFLAARDLSFQAVRALGLRDGITHMEWFRRPDGSLAVGEIAARPPGARIVQLTGLAHGFSMEKAWARAVVDGAFDGPWPRLRSTGVAFLRGVGKGKIASVDGLSEAQARMGPLVVDSRLPKVGAPRASGYEGEGWVVVADRDTARVKKALFDLITTVRVRYA